MSRAAFSGSDAASSASGPADGRIGAVGQTNLHARCLDVMREEEREWPFHGAPAACNHSAAVSKGSASSAGSACAASSASGSASGVSALSSSAQRGSYAPSSLGLPAPFFYSNCSRCVTPRTRYTLAHWMAQVCEHYGLRRSTFHLALAMADRYVHLQQPEKTSYQHVGVTALFTAATLEVRCRARHRMSPVGSCCPPCCLLRSLSCAHVADFVRILPPLFTGSTSSICTRVRSQRWWQRAAAGHASSAGDDVPGP
jgi:hypothetical protein